MKYKKIFVTVLSVLLLTLAFSGIGNAAPEDTQTVYRLEYGGLRINIVAPVEAYPGENITITVNTSSGAEPVFVKNIYIELYGLVNATQKVYLDQITHLNNYYLDSHTIQYTVTIPDNMSPGLTCGTISCEWEVDGAPQKIPSSGFVLTYVKNVALEQLQTDYNELNATFQSFVQNYTDLESTYTELETELKEEVDSTRSLMYIFVVTTAVAAVTVFVLLMRKPKRVWV
ncbi:MAG: hypothetical protein NWF03_06010 [Candidatus Bathyarchaeota archaeon]|nr:hypothetical protein [Candidatus Bathyarchaeota archaeon]